MDNLKFQQNNPSDSDKTNKDTTANLVKQALDSFAMSRTARDSTSWKMHKSILENILDELLPIIFPGSSPLKIHKLKNYGVDLLHSALAYPEPSSLYETRKNMLITLLGGTPPETGPGNHLSKYYDGYFDDDASLNDRDKSNIPQHIKILRSIEKLNTIQSLIFDDNDETSSTSPPPTYPSSPASQTSSISASPIYLSSITSQSSPGIENINTMCHVAHSKNEHSDTPPISHSPPITDDSGKMCHVAHFENENIDNSLDNELCDMAQFDMATSKGLGKGLGALISMFDEDMEELKSHESSSKTTIIKDTQTKTVQTENVPRGTLPPTGVTMTAGTINIDKLGAIEIDVNLIDNNLAQPRRTFDPDEMRELEQSILAHGVLQPILLNRVGTRYMIVAGERRWRASKAVGLRTIPALVRNYTPRQISEIALVENLIRSDLNEIETAQGIKRLMDNHSLTQEQVSNILTKNRTTISHSLRLLTLPTEVQQLLQQKKITMGHAKILITISDKARVISLANKCAQGMSVRELEIITSDDTRKTTTQKYTKPQSTELKQLTRNISELLGTRTTIQGTESQGKLTIEYHSKSELNRILDIIKKGLLR